MTAANKDNIRSYLGVPVFYKNGEIFGTLCAVDAKPTNFTTEDVETIQRFSNLFSYVVELEKRANYDVLTGLFSHSYLYDNFETFPEKGMLMSIDLDRFKQVNDQYGHEAGDIVLREVGRRIRKCLGKNDIGVRLGGDEFILYFRKCTDMEDMEAKGRQILAVLSNWNEFDYEIKVSASIGIVRIPEDGENLKILLKKADQAMYWTKNNGKDFYSFYHQ